MFLFTGNRYRHINKEYNIQYIAVWKSPINLYTLAPTHTYNVHVAAGGNPWCLNTEWEGAGYIGAHTQMGRADI